MILRCGKLYWFQNDYPNIEDMLIVRVCRWLKIDYIPWSVRKCTKVFLREEKSRYKRKLVAYCQKHGITTYVVEEGARYNGNHYGHIPLRADYFVCMEENKPFWSRFIPPGRLYTHIPEKRTEDYREIVFLYPLYTRGDILHPNRQNDTNITVMTVIHLFLKKEVVFKLHPKNRHIVEQFIPKHRLVDGKAEDLIKKYEKIYCFKTCSIRKDCEMLGITPIFVEDSLMCIE